MRNRKFTLDKVKQMINPEYVFFWGHTSKDGKIGKSCFSQWYEHEFTIDGITYSCAEQYMMAEKARLFGDKDNLEKILLASIPKTMKDLGRKVKGYDPEIWNQHKFDIVVTGNIAKFSQNEGLKDFLLSTGDKVLVEASPYDKIWGIGMRSSSKDIKDPSLWQGENLLGFALMEVRDLLRNQK